MKCFVAGMQIDKRSIHYAELNFGQPVKLPTFKYSLAYDRAEIADLLNEPYKTWLVEMKDEFVRDPDPFMRNFKSEERPTVESAMCLKDEFCEILRVYLYLDLFQLSFSGQAARWIINDIEEIRFEDDVISFAGEVYDIRGS